MGSPLGPVLIGIFIEKLRKDLITKLNEYMAPYKNLSVSQKVIKASNVKFSHKDNGRTSFSGYSG